MENPPQSVSKVVVGVPRERVAGENRVALVPDTVTQLQAIGVGVVVESGAGRNAFFDDEAYFMAGAEIVPDEKDVFNRADIVAKVQPPLLDEIALLKHGAFVISFLDGARNPELVARMKEAGVTAFSFNAVPRTTRAQSMDAMSAMSTVAGYKSVLLAADTIGRFFPLLMTAAGTVPPARLVVIGAGVAGLQALATARRLGAVTAACDVRAAVREQIESVGAKFIDMSVAPAQAEGEGGYARQLDEETHRRQRDAIREHIAGADVVISTAQVPGVRAPVLIDEQMLLDMRPGSVIVDLAAEAGGNCELTVAGEQVVKHGVTVLGPVNVPSTLPTHASAMYARNVLGVVKLLVKDGALNVDAEDDIISAACLTGVTAPEAAS